MDSINPKTKKLRQLATEQVQYYDDYYNKMIELERILSDCRMNISTAKSQNGFALSSVGIIDKRDIEPTVFVNIDKKKKIFEMASEAVNEEGTEPKQEKLRQRGGKEKSKKQDNEEAKEKAISEKKPQFRPFGVLEPRAAKQARSKADEAIQRILEISSIQMKIFSIEESISLLNSEIASDLGDDFQNLLNADESSKPSKSVKNLLKTVQWLQAPSS